MITAVIFGIAMVATLLIYTAVTQWFRSDSVAAEGWQTPTMMAMGLRRALGAIPAAMVFALVALLSVGLRQQILLLIIGVVLTVPAYIFLNPGNFFSVPFRKYIKWYRLYSLEGGARQVMAFAGEAGWQPGKKLQGLRYVIVAWNTVAYFPYTVVPANAVWYLRSHIGEQLPLGRKTARVMPAKVRFNGEEQEVEPMYFFEHPRAFMSVGGQLNVQRTFITPGYIGPIDLIAFQVDDGTLKDSVKPKEGEAVSQHYRPFRVPDNQYAMVTCLDSEHSMPQGAIFARLGGFSDIETIIDEKFPGEGKEKPVRKNTESTTNEEEARAPKGTSVTANEPKDAPDDIKNFADIFRYPVMEERSVAGQCLRKLLQGPQEQVEDYQNIRVFDEMEGTVGPHWRLVRPGRLLNLNRFVFDVTLIDPLVVDPGTAEVMILSTGTLARDITQKGFSGGRIVRVGGNGINVKALEPAQYGIPSLDLKRDESDESRRSGKLIDLVQVPTRQLSLFFNSNKKSSIYDAKLGSVVERSREGIEVTYDFNMLMTIPVEAAPVIVAAFGSPIEFISQVISTILYGVTVQFIREKYIKEIVEEQAKMLEYILKELQAAVSEKYGVQIHQVKMEHFAADAYLDVLEREAVAQAGERAVAAETKVAELNKKLQQTEGEAKAKHVVAVAEGDAKAINLRYGAVVKQFGREGAVAIEAVRQMTEGKHPFMPTTLGVAQGEGGQMGALLPSAAVVSGVFQRLNDAAEAAKKTATHGEPTSSAAERQGRSERRRERVPAPTDQAAAQPAEIRPGEAATEPPASTT